MDKLLGHLYHVIFVAAFLLAGVAVAEWALQMAGSSILQGQYTAGRLIEFAGIFMLFVIALLLRDIRNRK